MLKPSLRRLLDRLLLVPALVLVIGPVQTAAAAALGDYHVSGAGDDITGDGSQSNPWRTISKAVDRAQSIGDTNISVHVGPGTYDEDAGESFPIYLDPPLPLAGGTAGNSLTVTGPGEGLAVVIPTDTPLGLSGGGDGGFLAPFLLAMSWFEGSLEVSGLTFQVEGSGAPIAGGAPAVVSLPNGAEYAHIHDNEVEGLFLFHAQYYGGEDAYVQVSNNVVVDSPGPAVYNIWGVSSATTGMASVTRDIVIDGNAFFGDTGGTPCVLLVDSVGQGNADLDVAVSNNTVSGGGGVSLYVDVTDSEVDADLDIAFHGNHFIGTGGGLTQSLNASGSCNLVASIEISNNTITTSTGSPILYMNSGVNFGAQAEIDLRVDDNEITGGPIGAYVNFDSEQAHVVRNVTFTDNEITGGLSGGMVMSTSVSASTASFDQSFVFDGNSIKQNGSGLLIAQDLFGPDISCQAVITKNDISYNGFDEGKGLLAGGQQLRMYIGASSGDFSLDLRGNVIRTDGSTTLMKMHSSGAAEMTFALDGGGPQLGYNTFTPNDSPSASSLSIVFSTGVVADLNLNGNWWGTTDATAIEDMVLHGPDIPEPYAEVDLSNPLADGLTFSVSQPGDQIKLTAGAGSGFVPYAGTMTIAVTVDGDPVSNLSVASDYGSLSFDNEYSGSVEICVTNPGGQSGCLTSTVTAAEDGDSGGGGGGGCGVMPMSGGAPTAGDFLAQYFLLLLPVLFMLRRRMSGVRPQPVGYVV